MTKSERKTWNKAIKGLEATFLKNVSQIEKLEKKNDRIMKEIYSKIDQFEKDCEANNNY